MSRLMNLALSDIRGLVSFFLVLTLLNPLPAYAQAQPKFRVFQWKFSSNTQSVNVLTCDEIPITVSPWLGNSTGVPPYYMMGYTTNGVSRPQFIGTDPSKLKWKVDFPPETKLLLTVVDSEGTPGGFGPNTINVAAGQNTNCVVKDDGKRDFTISANITDKMDTCEPWGLTIKGGVRPYNLTLFALDSPVVTNVTMGAQDDGFAYIMRGDPGKRLFAVVNDITGRFAFGAPNVMPTGSTNTECPGKNSISGSAAVFEKEIVEANALAAAQAKRKRNKLIVATVIPILVLLLVLGGVAVWYFLWYRKRRTPSAHKIFSPFYADPSPDTSGDTSLKQPYIESTAPGTVLSINTFLTPPDSPTTHHKTPSVPALPPVAATHFSPSLYPDSPIGSMSARSMSTHHTRRPNFAAFPPPRRANSESNHPMSTRSIHPKAVEAGFSLDFPGEPSGSGLPLSASRSLSVQYAAGSPDMTRTTSFRTTAEGNQEVVIQHLDGGPRVRELPSVRGSRRWSPVNEAKTEQCHGSEVYLLL